MATSRWVLALSVAVGGCAAEVPDDELSEDVAGLGGFDRNYVVSDEFFVTPSFDAAGIQAFFEASPHGGRSWLADETVEDGRTVAQALADAASNHRINPMMLVARLQMEQSLVARRAGPSVLDKAFGCGCPDGGSCSARYRGFEKQIECAAERHRALFDDGLVGSMTNWSVGESTTSEEGQSVRPRNQATSALYAYTPWVGSSSFGNRFLWNTLTRYAAHIGAPGPTAGGSGPGEGTTRPAAATFIGSACTSDDECTFTANGERGRCLRYGADAARGVCTVSCAGRCPDRSGFATTFCTSVGGQGLCLSKADAENDQCSALPETAPTMVDRFVGASSASAATATVCWPSGHSSDR